MKKKAREFRQLQSACLQVDKPERLSFHSWLSPLLVSGLVFALGEARDQPHFKKNSRGLPFQSPQTKKPQKTAIARPWPSFASILLKPKVHNRPRPTIASDPPPPCKDFAGRPKCNFALLPGFQSHLKRL
uniref:Uncharacterized protein n=1 Tax=Micrurus surinamensis TaxID=129470 RepID=A0A2D4PP72_MICSU